MKTIFGFIFVVGIIVFPIGNACSQTKVQISALYSSFYLNDIRKSQQNRLNYLPFEAKIVDDFPPYWGIKGKLLFQINNTLNIGVTEFLTSTGGRISYQDYSGSFLFDQNLILNSLGGTIEAIVHKQEVLSIYFGISLNADYSIYDFSSELIVLPDYQETEKQKLSAFGMSIWPYLELDQKLIENVFVNFAIGYQQKLFISEFKNDTYMAVAADWSGIRAEIGISYIFNAQLNSD